MTVGIAALCQEGPQGEIRYVILTSDRMITGGDIEYEPDKAKLYWLTPTGHIVALIAGDSAAQSAIGQAAALQIAAEGVTDVKSAAEIFATQMADHSRSMAEREHLYPLGQDLSSFVPTSATIAPGLVTQLSNKLLDYELGVEAIVAGVEPGGVAHIYTIDEPGMAACHDITGFVAIGVGGRHAETEFMSHRYKAETPPWEALFLSYTAKRRAESAPGVGVDTDITVVSLERGPLFLPEAGMKKLREGYKKVQSSTAAIWDEQKEYLEQVLGKATDEKEGDDEPPDDNDDPPAV